MKKIKICYVIVNCKITGPMNQTLNIIKNINKEEFEVYLLTLIPESEKSLLEEYKKYVDKFYCLNLNKIQMAIIGSYRVNDILKKWKPDIVQGLGIPPYRTTLRYKDAKHFLTLRNYIYEDYPSKYNMLLGNVLAIMDMNLIKKLYKNGEKFVTCSESLSNIYEKNENIRIPFIRNGVDVERYERKKSSEVSQIRDNLNLPKDKIIFIYTGQIIDRKNQEETIQAFLKCNNCSKMQLVICGDGNNLCDLKKKYNSYDNLVFTGKVDNIAEYLRASDIFISSSKSEGMPNSVLEAMATGLPVILSNIPQHMELFGICNGIGKYYQLGDQNELKEKIEEMTNCDLNMYSNNSYNTVINNLTSKIMSENYQAVYHKMIERNT